MLHGPWEHDCAGTVLEEDFVFHAWYIKSGMVKHRARLYQVIGLYFKLYPESAANFTPDSNHPATVGI